MRRIISLFLTLMVLCSLAACGGTPEPQPEVDSPARGDVGEVADPGSDGPSEPEPTPVPTPGPTPGVTLPRTGQLNWPVPVLTLLGVGLFAAGWLLRFGRGRSHD